MMIFTLLSILLVFSVRITNGQMKATATLHFDMNETNSGIITFTQANANSPVIVTGTLKGLVPYTMLHGFHVHQTNIDGTLNCTAANGHFNPYNKLHGGQNFTIDHRHVGDLGNVWVDGSGTAMINITDYIIQLYNQTQSIANRTLVVHQMTDDNGLGNSTDSNTTGHAGIRLACGVIRITSSGNILSNAPWYLFMISLALIFICHNITDRFQ
ncbi:unnamed protein product [Didymodactylos carnosus]|uniref:Superoxide dismutase [Cu-Zn] n=1 Tax=Didymodactylos carnosus TaxID=1234261 RepID=A0A8S2EYH8_9BILA|nr:unnamed protein product [Didymodactylos carnosus]CAF4160534.1 unnamed protein product [Didymodactylos carnosus]